MTTYLHYLPPDVPAPAVGTQRHVGSEDNHLWRRKRMPWPTGGMYPITQADREWAAGEAARLGCSPEEALKSWIEFRQQRDIQQEVIFEANRPAHLPSRQRCMYVWDDRDDFEADARSFDVDSAAQVLIRICPVPGQSTVHRVSLDALNVLNNASQAELVAAAKRYWEGAPAPGPRTELLLIGWYAVVAF